METWRQMLEHAHVRCRIDMQYLSATAVHRHAARAGHNRLSGEIMKTRIAVAALFAAAFLTAVPASYAAAGSIPSPVHAMYFHGEKKIKFSLRNETGAPLELKVGDQVMTLQAGQVAPFKLPVGTRITTNTATEHHPVGSLILEVTAGMYSDSTTTIK
jgi:hypothetical protein